VSDFDTTQLLSDWDAVTARAGSLTAVTGGVTFSGVWAQRNDMLADMQEQLRNEKRFTVFTTFTELSTVPSIRQTLVRSGITYAIEAVRTDAELVGIEFDVKSIL
jgi:pectate lyase